LPTLILALDSDVSANNHKVSIINNTKLIVIISEAVKDEIKVKYLEVLPKR
jgi:hypothetical protein